MFYLTFLLHDLSHEGERASRLTFKYFSSKTGVYHEWKANSTGRSAQTVREFLEKNYTPEIAARDDQVIKLAIRALLEVVQGKNLEVAIMKHNTPMKLLTTNEVNAIVAEVEKEREELVAQ